MLVLLDTAKVTQSTSQVSLLNSQSPGSGSYSDYISENINFQHLLWPDIKGNGLSLFLSYSSLIQARQFRKKMKDKITKCQVTISILRSCCSTAGWGSFNILQRPWQLLLRVWDMQFRSLILWVFVPFSLTTKRNKDPNYTHNHYYLKKFPVIKF